MEETTASDARMERELERMIGLYADSLLRVCFVCLKDRMLAEDAMQETFERAWANRAILFGLCDAQKKAWLTRTALNLCRDTYRSHWFRHVKRRVTLDDLPPRSVSMTPGEEALLIDVCNLPEKAKQVILLYYYQELSMQEVGQTLGISAAAVCKRLKKATALLKERLAGRDEHEFDQACD